MVSNLTQSRTPYLFLTHNGAPCALTPAGVAIAFLAGFMVCFFRWWCRALSHGGRAAQVRTCGLVEWQLRLLDARTCAAGAVRVITSVDGRITSSVYLMIVKVDARSVAGLSVNAAGDE